MLYAVQNLFRVKINYVKSSSKNRVNKKDLLSLRQLHVLFMIKYFKMTTITDIAKYLSLSNAGLSLIISKMEQSGYIEKKYPAISDDGRKVIVCLTDKGEKELKNLIAEFTLNMEQLNKGLSEEEIRIIYEGYDKIASITQDYNEVDLKVCLVEPLTKSQEICMGVLKNIVCISNWCTNYYFNEFDTNGKKKNKLTVNQFNILYLIYTFKENSISELSGVLDVSESTMSTAIKKLTVLGYLEKERQNLRGDARKKICYITNEGIDILKTTTNRLLTVFKEYYETLNDEQKVTLYEGLSLIISLKFLEVKNER